MATSYTSLLGLALPVTGELAGTWGDTVNNSITSLLDTAVAGTTTLSTDADVTLTTTTGASNQARQAILLCSGARTALRTITAPAQSKIYVVINNTTGGFGVKLVGVGPTTGITVAAGKTAVLVWNGSDFVEVAPATATTATNLAGGAAGSLPYQSGAGATTFLSIGTANRVLISSGTAPQWSNSLSGLASIVSTGNISGTSLTIHPTLNGKIGANTAWIGENSTATVAVGMYQAGSGSTTIANLNFISSGSTIRGVISCTEESGGDAAYLAFSTRNAAASVGERMRITASGNVGIGVTPNAWDATYQALQMESSGGPSLTGGNAELYLSTNAYYNAGWKYGASSQPALRYAQNNGQHQWFYSPSGTAGNAITFTQAMTLDASGNLGIGISAPTNTLSVAGNANVTGNTTLGDGSTDTVTVNGYMGVGIAANAGVSLRINSASTLTGTTQRGLLIDGTASSASTASYSAAEVSAKTQAAAYTVANVHGLFVTDATKGAGSTITNQYGIYLSDQTQGTNNYGIRSLVSSGANKWNIYADGTAANYFAGNVGIGVTAPGAKLEVESGAGVRATYAADADDFAIDGPGNTGLTISSERASLGSIIFADNDSNFRGGVQYTHATNDLYLSTSGTERLRIDSAGNVGIGITAPGALLDVASATGGVLRLTSTDTSIVAADELLGKVEMFASDASLGGTAVGASISALSEFAFVGGGTPTYLALATAPVSGTVTERMRITSAGNVGIGTASPGSPLTVYAGNNQATIKVTNGPSANNVGITLESTGGNVVLNNGNGPFELSTGGSIRAVVTAAGLVGIGTAAPAQLLHIASGDATALIENTVATSNATLQLKYPSRTWALANRGADLSGAFAIRDVTAGADRLTITSAGNVGIGTTTPGAKLDVAGTTRLNIGTAVGIRIGADDGLTTVTDNTLKVGSLCVPHYQNANQPMGVIAGIATSTANAVEIGGNSGSLNSATQITFYTAATTNTSLGPERMRITSAGNVGIGTASPVNKLQINGSLGRNAPVTKTGNFTLADTENWLICNGTGTITVTLPAASSWTGREVMIKTIAAFTVVSASSNVVPLAGGAAGTAILAATAGRFATLVSDGTNWIIMQAN